MLRPGNFLEVQDVERDWYMEGEVVSGGLGMGEGLLCCAAGERVRSILCGEVGGLDAERWYGDCASQKLRLAFHETAQYYVPVVVAEDNRWAGPCEGMTKTLMEEAARTMNVQGDENV